MGPIPLTLVQNSLNFAHICAVFRNQVDIALYQRLALCGEPYCTDFRVLNF